MPLPADPTSDSAAASAIAARAIANAATELVASVAFDFDPINAAHVAAVASAPFYGASIAATAAAGNNNAAGPDLNVNAGPNPVGTAYGNSSVAAIAAQAANNNISDSILATLSAARAANASAAAAAYAAHDLATGAIPGANAAGATAANPSNGAGGSNGIPSQPSAPPDNVTDALASPVDSLGVSLGVSSPNPNNVGGVGSLGVDFTNQTSSIVGNMDFSATFAGSTPQATQGSTPSDSNDTSASGTGTGVDAGVGGLY